MLGEFERICKQHPDPQMGTAWMGLRKAAVGLLRMKIDQGFNVSFDESHVATMEHEFRRMRDVMCHICGPNKVNPPGDLSPMAFADWLLKY